jgi:N-formylglutamate amidohydrolase
MTPDPFVVHGPREPSCPLVLDSPHSGRVFPPSFGAVLGEHELREGEDSFVDQLWRPAAERGAPLLAATFPRTFIDPNRHEADIDLALLDGPWPYAHRPSEKAAVGKGLIWRTLDEDRPIYDRLLGVAEARERIERYLWPYQRALSALLGATHRRFGVVYHLNCHSMGSETSVAIEGVKGQPRADFVVGDRDGTTCAPELTRFVAEWLAERGWRVAVNDPFKGVELVRYRSDPAGGRHSLQLEINKRLYMDEKSREPHEGFAALQRQLTQLVDALLERFGSGR